VTFTPVSAELTSSALDWFRRGEAFIGTEKENSEEHSACFEKVLEIAPDFVPARFNLVLIYLHQEKLDLASEHCNMLVKLAPEDARILRLRAQVFARKANFAEAAADLERAAQMEPGNYEIWNELGMALYELGRLDESLAAYEQTIRLNPAAPAEIYFEVALVHQALGNLGEATENCKRFLAASPDDFQGNFLLGVLLRQQGQDEKALQYLLKAEYLNPNHPDVEAELHSLYLDLGDLKEAEKRSGEGIERLVSLGLVAKERADWEQAARYFVEALGREPENSVLYAHLGDVLVKQGKTGEAIDAYRQAINRNSEDFNSLINLAILFSKTGRSQEALSLLEQAVLLRPDSGLAHLNLALLLETLGDPEAARTHYAIAIERGESNPIAHFRLAILLSKESQVDQALDHLAAAFEKDAGRYVPMVLNELRNVSSDLDSIRYTARFSELLNKYRKELENHN